MVMVTVRVKASVIALRLRHALRNACIDRRPAVARAEYYLSNASYAWATDRDRTAAVGLNRETTADRNGHVANSVNAWL